MNSISDIKVCTNVSYSYLFWASSRTTDLKITVYDVYDNQSTFWTLSSVSIINHENPWEADKALDIFMLSRKEMPPSR